MEAKCYAACKWVELMTRNLTNWQRIYELCQIVELRQHDLVQRTFKAHINGVDIDEVYPDRSFLLDWCGTYLYTKSYKH